MHPVALLFPGQGSQSVGMDAGLDRATFDEADAALGTRLSAIIREGPEARLAETEHTQPAILAVSIAMLRALWERQPELRPVAAAGHSLGEYGALVAAGSLDFGDALRLVRLRGQAMQEAVPLGVGAMAAILGLEPERVEALCVEQARGEVVELAGLNCPGQIVVAGHVAAVDRVVQAATDAGGLGKRLAVSAPFHCSLLSPAADRLREALTEVPLRPPAFPVVHNADADVAPDTEAIRARLVDQVVRPVRWIGCVRRLVELGAQGFIEVGPGRTLAGLGKRIDRGRPVRHASEVT